MTVQLSPAFHLARSSINNARIVRLHRPCRMRGRYQQRQERNQPQAEPEAARCIAQKTAEAGTEHGSSSHLIKKRGDCAGAA